MSKLTEKRSVKFLFILGIPIIICLLLTIKPIITMISGTEIQLLTKPVDPTDLFYGDYVQLDYEIEDISKYQMSPNMVNRFKEDEYQNIEVYGILIQKDDVHELEKVVLKKPKNGVFLKGTLTSYTHYEESNKEKRIYEADFGLDRYFVPENSGTKLEKAAKKGRIVAKVKVNNGYGILTDIFEIK